MSIVRYDRFRELRSLQEEMPRLFTGKIDIMGGDPSSKTIEANSKTKSANG